MTTAWLVTANCGDFYCEGDHVVAVASTEAEAERLKAEAVVATNHYSGRDFPIWEDVEVESVEIDALRTNA